MYRVFVRNWWREATRDDGAWPNNLVPCPGRKRTIGKARTEQEAQAMCQQYNSTHDPGRYSRKAEYEAL